MSFLPLNGFMMILQNPSLGLTEELFPNNPLNSAGFFVVNASAGSAVSRSAIVDAAV